MKTDAEIFKRNIKRICKQKGMKIGCVDLEAGYSEKYVSQMAYKKSAVTTDHIRSYARALGVKPGRLIEGMFDDGNAQIFRRNVRALCDEQGITLAEVMEKAGYNANHLHHLVSKHAEPSDEAIGCYAKALGVKPERLTEGIFDEITLKGE